MQVLDIVESKLQYWGCLIAITTFILFFSQLIKYKHVSLQHSLLRWILDLLVAVPQVKLPETRRCGTPKYSILKFALAS
jgi:hypothetical protein